MSNVQIKNSGFLARANKKQNVEIYSFASSRGQEKYIKRVSFSWSLLEATPLIFSISFSVKNHFLRRD
jgi:hypothetical protein